MKAGAFTPATRGRGSTCPKWLMPRSMKAGAFTPATPVVHADEGPLADERSMKAGAFTPATPLPPDLRRRLVEHRSMKAGAFTPATPITSLAERTGAPALNEGGGFHPRNPASKTLSINLRDFWPEQVVILTDHTL